MKTLSFHVPGIPAPGGSKRFVGFGKKTGRAILIDDAGERNKNWRTSVAQCGNQARGTEPMFEGPLQVRMVFCMPRPKGHFGAKGLKPSAPIAPTTKPDVLKLARSTEDALTGIVWLDDAQTVILNLEKSFVSSGEASGCDITINALT